MIGKLKGIVDSIGGDCVIIDVGGVGYDVQCASKTLASLPKTGEAVTLYIETYVREDMIRLYGFTSGIEKDWFKLLQSVQGVGAKVALAILSALSIEELSSSIVFQDKSIVGRASGVGPKLAVRIVNELKDKAPTSDLVIEGGAGKGDVAHAASDHGLQMDAVSALINLGYQQSQAAGAVRGATGLLGEGARLDDLIREGLKQLAS
jgi:holliday junction DNA helicase RuvA